MENNKFKGTGVALITPFLDNGDIDFESLKKLVHKVTEGGVDYLVALGTTSESPTLNVAEKLQVLKTIIECNIGKLPLVCGIGGNNTKEVIEYFKTFSIAGVDGILSVTPYYNKPSQNGLYAHFKALSECTDLPIILYNVPGRTGSNILPETVCKLATDCKNIIAVKEASGSIVQCMELIRTKPKDFLVLSGDDNLILAQIAIGMEGIISVAANCFPKEFTEVVNLALAENYNNAQEKFYKILPGIDLLFIEGNPAGVKEVLHKIGVCKNNFRLPVVGVSEATSKKIDTFLYDVGML